MFILLVRNIQNKSTYTVVCKPCKKYPNTIFKTGVLLSQAYIV
jgi:hypothetical protein